MPNTTDLNQDNFDQFLDSDKVVVVYFHADWCAPCKAFRPTFNLASEQHKDACFGFIDTEQQEVLAQDFEIRSVPSLMIFREHVALCRESGTLSASELDQLIGEAKALDMEEVHKQIAKNLMQ